VGLIMVSFERERTKGDASDRRLFAEFGLLLLLLRFTFSFLFSFDRLASLQMGSTFLKSCRIR